MVLELKCLFSSFPPDNFYVILPEWSSGELTADKRHGDLQKQCPPGCEKYHDGTCEGWNVFLWGCMGFNNEISGRLFINVLSFIGMHTSKQNIPVQLCFSHWVLVEKGLKHTTIDSQKKKTDTEIDRLNKCCPAYQWAKCIICICVCREEMNLIRNQISSCFPVQLQLCFSEFILF